jgi:hypothetical protein
MSVTLSLLTGIKLHVSSNRKPKGARGLRSYAARHIGHCNGLKLELPVATAADAEAAVAAVGGDAGADAAAASDDDGDNDDGGSGRGVEEL